MAQLGTEWVAPGEGSTWRELYDAFHVPPCERVYGQHTLDEGGRTNLKLTGAPIQDYDRQRWESGNVRQELTQ